MKKFLAIFLSVLIVFGVCACSAEKSIIGTWKYQTTVLGVVTETSYTFNEDGTGKVSTVLDVAFTYKFENDKLCLTITTFGIENTEEYDYEFKGNSLILTDSDGSITLEKVK
ncbi:MAG: hypothetical protein IJ946_01725 [Clostridia bacterium]|nr:hypothetical protein [Clostridia bacterium]